MLLATAVRHCAGASTRLSGGGVTDAHPIISTSEAAGTKRLMVGSGLVAKFALVRHYLCRSKRPPKCQDAAGLRPAGRA